jgi:AsmA protein
MQESMQQTSPTIDPLAAEAVARRTRRGRIAVAAAVLALLLLTILPPFINVSRLQRRVTRNISASLGRPVHFDNITLNLLPILGFTLQNFVVDEDPAFGSEPILRASQVRVNLRISSLWGPHVEFSHIALTDPSVNLVRTADGQWNLQSIILQASRTQAAPTDQRFAGSAPRFPYIEASGARLNLKLDQVKTPFSLNEADFALWLPQPHQWRLRLEAHPVRTDTNPADTGSLRVEATLGAPDADAANTSAGPLDNLLIDLHGSWQDVQLGGLSRLLVAHDAGLRGELSLSVNILGTLGHNTTEADVQLRNARREDFVPSRLLSIDADCHAIAQNSFHSFTHIECYWPPSASSGPSTLILTANLPDVRQLSSASAALTLPSLPPSTFLNWIGVATPHPPTGLTGPGNLAGNLAWNLPSQLQSDSNSASAPSIPRSSRIGRGSSSQPPAQPVLSGELEFSNETLNLPALGTKPIPLGDLLLRSTPPLADHSPRHSSPNPPMTSANATSFDLLPISLPLGGRQPATLEGHLDASGYSLHLTGSVLLDRLLALGDAFPQLGDGLRPLLQPAPADDSSSQPRKPIPQADPIHIDLTATRAWGGPQTWSQTITAPTNTHHLSKP